MISYDDLKDQAERLIAAQATVVSDRITRDDAKIAVREVEATVRFEGVGSGEIAGKNAEQREAEETILRRRNPDWQVAADKLRHAEEQLLNTQGVAAAEELRLRVMAMGFNAQIADKTGGAAKLLADVGLAAVS